VQTLDDHSAMQALLSDLGVSLDEPRRALSALRRTLVGLTDANETVLARGGQFGPDTRVRHLLGVDPVGQAIAVSDQVQVGQQLAFCRRDVEAARRDLVRICAEIRDEVDIGEPVPAGQQSAGEAPAPRIAGAIYVSCSGRGGPHFGAPSAEAQIVRRALGDVPLVGYFAAGEVARHHLYGYTGVLTVFVER
jgi:small ligand-binding sensory domain FIST